MLRRPHAARKKPSCVLLLQLWSAYSFLLCCSL
uniref:Uncharacterized protein n=1 Tax=Arundo donax TaxID=35708 RepID=A0A0A9AJA5_ARUDO